MSKQPEPAKSNPKAKPKLKASSKQKAAPKRKAATRKAIQKLAGRGKSRDARLPVPHALSSEMQSGATAAVLDRLFDTVTTRRHADPNVSHSARLLSRGRLKVAQKFGEEAVECLIEAVAGNSEKLIGESADMLYHLIVMWVDAGLSPGLIWAELQSREGISGIAEKASRATRHSTPTREPGSHRP